MPLVALGSPRRTEGCLRCAGRGLDRCADLFPPAPALRQTAAATAFSGPLEIQIPVYLPAMANHRHNDNAGAVIHGIDHAVIPGAHPQIRTVTGKRSGTGRPWVGGQAVNDTRDNLAGGGV